MVKEKVPSKPIDVPKLIHSDWRSIHPNDEHHHYQEREIERERHKAARGSAIGQYKAVILSSLKYS